MASVKTTITEQGLALIDSIINGSGELAFTGIEIGDGENINSSALVTELVNKRMDVAISKVYASDDGTTVCGNVDNSTVTESFEIREIGVFAKQEGSEDAPILFAYTECEGVGGIPAASIVAINNEMLITLATGNANVLYIDNPTAALTRQDIIELKQHIEENYFTKSDIRSGVQTQTVFGYDPMTGADSKNRIYLTGDTVSVANGGDEVVFPKKSGTVALTSEVEALEADINNLADTKQDRLTESRTSNNVGDIDPDNVDSTATIDQMSSLDLQVGTLAEWGFEGDAVRINKITLFRREGATDNGSTNMWLRLLRWNGSAWYVAYQATTYVTHGSYTNNGQRIEHTMTRVAGSAFIPTNERVVVCYASSESASATSLIEFGMKVVPSSTAMLANALSSVPTNLSFTVGWSYRLAADFEYVSAQSLEEMLAGKADAEHTHSIADVYGLQTALDAKQDKLTAGDGITIVDGTISAAGGGSVTVDAEIAEGGTNPVTGGAIHTALEDKAALSVVYNDTIPAAATATAEIRQGNMRLKVMHDVAANTYVDLIFNDETGGAISQTLLPTFSYLSAKVDPLAERVTALEESPSASAHGINPDGAVSHTATQTYDETSGYTYTKDVTATENGYLSCQATQTHESDAANKIILTCSINGTVIHKDCANGYGDMASILIPVAKGQTVNVQATSSEPATVEVKFMPLLQ